MTMLRVRVPAQVQAPRGAVAAAALMVQLLRGIASVTATVLAPAGSRVVPAPVSVLHD
jgi:hypothetical protein